MWWRGKSISIAVPKRLRQILAPIIALLKIRLQFLDCSRSLVFIQIDWGKIKVQFWHLYWLDNSRIKAISKSFQLQLLPIMQLKLECRIQFVVRLFYQCEPGRCASAFSLLSIWYDGEKVRSGCVSFVSDDSHTVIGTVSIISLQDICSIHFF